MHLRFPCYNFHSLQVGVGEGGVFLGYRAETLDGIH